MHFPLILCYLGWVARSSDGGVKDLVILLIDDSLRRQAERPVQCDPLVVPIKFFLMLLMAFSQLICYDLNKQN